MDADLFFVVGLILSVFALPPILGALTDGRAPRAAAIMVLVGGGMVSLAVKQHPNRYTIEGIPDTFVRVVGKYIN